MISLRGLATPWVRTVAVLTIVQVVTELAFSFVLPFTPLDIQELGIHDVADVGLWAGLIAGLFAVAMGVMAPIWGPVADRFGHRLMIQRATFGAGIVIAGVAFVQTPEQLLALRILHGIFTGVVSAIATAVSLTAPRQHLGTVLGMLQAAMFTGVSLGPVLGGAVVAGFCVQAVFLAPAFALAGWVVARIRPQPAPTPKPAAARAPDHRAGVALW